jgi:L-iditol 2-dehydrogenase
MRAIVKTAAGQGFVELQERSEPAAGTGEVLLEIGAATICGTDVHILAGEYPCRVPVTLGHEFCGTIVELGAGVSGWAVGDRVTSLPFAIVCGECRYCRAGEYGLCAARRSYGSGVDGAFARYLAVKASGLFRLPDHQDFIAGALTEPLACVVKAVFEIGALQPNESVAVIGPGPIGLLTVQAVRAVGCQVTLIGLRQDAGRIQLGHEFGAANSFYADEADSAEMIAASGADGFDVVFECSGAGRALTTALSITRKCGRLIQVGLFGKPVQADMDQMVFKDLIMRGSFTSSRSSWRRALELTGNGLVNTRPLVSDVFPLSEWQAAFTKATDRSGLKVAFIPRE